MAAENLFVNSPNLPAMGGLSQSAVQYIPPNTVIAQGALAKKLSEVMHEVTHVEKAGTNKFQNYNYQRATDMAQAVRKSLAAKHIVMLPDIIETRSYEVPAKEGVMQAVDLKVRYTFVDGDSGATLSFVGMGTGFDKGDKAVYKAHTGALKYALKDFFMIPEEGDDPEADESTDKQASDEQRPVQRPTQTPIPKPPMSLGDRNAQTWGEKTKKPITAPQLARLRAIAGKNKLGAKEVLNIVGRYGFEKAEEVTMDRYNEVVAAIENTNLEAEPF